MKFTYDTTSEMDAALSFNATKNNQAVAELFKTIVDSEMKTLTNNYTVSTKDKYFETYQKAEPTDKEAIDAIIEKVAIAALEPES